MLSVHRVTLARMCPCVVESEGSPPPTLAPEQLVESLTQSVKQVAAGIDHCVALTTDGALYVARRGRHKATSGILTWFERARSWYVWHRSYTWGGNSHGQLGIGVFTESGAVPQKCRDVVAARYESVRSAAWRRYVVAAPAHPSATCRYLCLP